MNHCYRLVWNATLGAWCVTHEHARSRGKKAGGRTLRAVAAAVALLGAGASHALDPAALPGGARIVDGRASLVQGGSATAPVLTIQQSSDRLIANWSSFDIGSAATVRFVQPGSGSVALNRVLGSQPTQVLGQLQANGQVFLVNPSGVVFGAGARVDVGGLLATSLAISDDNALAGRWQFANAGGAGAVVNEGAIQGIHIVLAAPRVDNRGSIRSAGGSIMLAGADAFSLQLGSSGLVGLTLDRGAAGALLANSGSLVADGGSVTLSARAAGQALAAVVNNDGVVQATRLQDQGGRILLDAGDAGSVGVEGRLLATGTAQGGDIAVTGAQVRLGTQALLDASGAAGGGRVRVGGGWQGTDATLANATRVDVAAGALLRADAGATGDGGQLVVWSDGRTGFAGTLSARGGALAGDGGRIEVSGKQDLLYAGRADARADAGATGSLLLDPATLTVQVGAAGGGLTGSTVTVADLQAQNANVLLQATGNVTFADLSLNGGNGRLDMANNVSLRVEGGTGGSGNITFANAANTISVSGTGSLMFVAGSTGTGTITNAPNLVVNGTGSNPGSLPTHTVTSVGSGTPTAGSITLYGADGVTVGGSLTTHGGYVRIWGDSDNMGGGGLTLSAPVATSGGNLHLSTGTSAININSNMTLGAGRLFFRADGTYSTGTRVLGGVLSATGDVNVNTAFQMNAGASILTDGVIRLSSTVNLNTGSGVLTLRGSAIDFTGATLQNLTTASMRLEPADPATNMVLGDASGFASAATLNALPGIRNLTIGRYDGTGTVSTVSNFSFNANGSLEVVNRNVSIGAGATLANTGGNVIVTGDNISIGSAITANGGSGKVTLRQMTAANSLHLGGGLSNASIGNVNAATLAVGRADGGDLVFDSDISTTASAVSLLSGARVLGVDGGVSATNLSVTAGGGATISSSTFNFSTLSASLGGSAAAPTSITSSSANWGLGTVDGVAGLSVMTGQTPTITLTATGTLTTSATLALNAAAATLNLRGATLNTAGATLSGQANAGITLDKAVSGALTLGGAGSNVTAASLLALSGVRDLTAGSVGEAVTIEGAITTAVGNRFTIVGDTLAGLGGARSLTTTSGGMKLQTATGALQIDAAVTAAGTLVLETAGGQGISGSGVVTANALAVRATAADVALDGATHGVGTLAGDVGSLRLSNGRTLTVGSVDGLAGVTASGTVDLRTSGATSDVVLNQAITASNANAAAVPLLLAAGRNFINNVGASALTATGGAWRVYATNPAADTRGGLLPDFKQYDATTASTVLGSGNGLLYRVAPSLTVSLTGSTSKVYDGSTTATLIAGNFGVSGAIDGDTVTLDLAAVSASYDTRHAATGKTVSATGVALGGASNGLVSVYGYSLPSGSASGAIGTITAKTVALSDLTVADKVYDGGTSATAGGVAARVGSDVLGFSGTLAFADKNAGSGKTVTLSGLALTGADAGNYQLAGVAGTTTGTITAKALTLTGATASGKVYDGGTAATLGAVTFSGVVGSDDVTASGSGQFADRNVGTGKTVTVGSLVLGGTDAGNYTLSGGAFSTTADITAKTLTVGAATVAGKVYDGNTNATVSAIGLTGVVGSDVVTTSATGQFANKNAGTGKTVTVSGITLGGADAGNYVLSGTTSSGTADITAKTLTVGAATVAGKAYDGNTSATVSAIGLTGVVGSDVVTTSATGQFADKNAGVGKTVTVSGITLGGADAGNYVLSGTTSSGTATITAKTLTVGAATVAGKVYDGNTSATVSSVGLTGVVGSDVVTTSATGQFADKNVGTGKEVTVSGIALGGADAGNYVLSGTTSSGTADITAKTLTVGAATVAGKVYDGNTSATVSNVSLTGVVGSDVVTTSATGQFANKNAGVGKTVTVSGITLGGADAGNYVLSGTTSSGTATITAKTLTVGGATVAGKVYDGSTAATVSSVGLTGVVGSDVVTTSATGQFADKNVGTGKVVTVSGIALGGADAGNYVLNSSSSSGTASITARTLTVGAATVAGKVYDGSTGATVSSVVLGGVVSGDAVSTAATGQFADKNVGTGKVVTVSGITLGGADAGNYVLGSTSSSGTADISAKTLTVGDATVAGKVYDGSTSATVSAIGLSGVVGGDAVTSSASGQFADKNVGSGKAVTVSGIVLSGADAGNYVLASTGTTGTASITARTLTVGAATVAGKVYDGSTAATVSSLSLTGVVGGDAVTSSASGEFADKNAGLGKSVAITGIALGGADAGNYVLASTRSSGTADIAPKTLGVAGATVAGKVYDGSTAATVSNVSLVGLVSGDAVTTTASGQFADKNAGLGKAVSVSGIALAGADARNYVLDSVALMAVGDIAPRLLDYTVLAQDRAYDGQRSVTVQFGDNRITGDLLQWSYGSALMADKNAGTGKAVAVAGIALGGADAANYRIASPAATTTVSIAPRLLTVSMAADKVFDGSAVAQVVFADDRVAGDQLSVSAGQAGFADRNAGAAKTVTATGLLIGGADAANYRLASTTLTGSASIAQAPLTLVLLDATATATGQPFAGGAGYTVLGLQGSDTAAALQGTPVYGGTAQGAVYVGSYTLTMSGLTSANYAISVRPATLTLTAQVDNSPVVRGLTLAGQGGNGTADAPQAATAAPAPSSALLRPGAGAGALAAGQLGSLVTDRSAAPLATPSASATEPATAQAPTQAVTQAVTQPSAPAAPAVPTTTPAVEAPTAAATAPSPAPAAPTEATAAQAAASTATAATAPTAPSAPAAAGRLVAVYRSELGVLQPQGVLQVAQADGVVQATATATPAPMLSAGSLLTGRHGTVTPAGGGAPLPLSLSADGVLLVSLPADGVLPADMAAWTSALLNLASTQLGWAPEKVRAVVLR